METDENEPKTAETDSQIEDRYEKARKMLGGLPFGGHIDVIRTKPNYCKGYLDRIDASEDEPVSLEDLRDEYGGKTLLLRAYDKSNKYLGATTIHFQEPPKKDGKPLRYEDSDEAETERARRLPAQSDNSNTELIKIILAQQNQMMQQMTGVFQAQLTAAQKQNKDTSQNQDPLANVERLSETLERLETLRGKIGGGGNQDGGGINFQKGIDALIELFASKQRHEMDLELAKVTKATQAAQPLPLPARQIQPVQPHETAKENAQRDRARFIALTPEQQREKMKNSDPIIDPLGTQTPIKTQNDPLYRTQQDWNDALNSEQPTPAPTPAPTPQNMDDAALIMAVAARFQKMNTDEQTEAVQALLQMVDPAVLERLGEDTEEQPTENTEQPADNC